MNFTNHYSGKNSWNPSRKPRINHWKILNIYPTWYSLTLMTSYRNHDLSRTENIFLFQIKPYVSRVYPFVSTLITSSLCSPRPHPRFLPLKNPLDNTRVFHFSFITYQLGSKHPWGYFEINWLVSPRGWVGWKICSNKSYWKFY